VIYAGESLEKLRLLGRVESVKELLCRAWTGIEIDGWIEWIGCPDHATALESTERGIELTETTGDAVGAKSTRHILGTGDSLASCTFELVDHVGKTPMVLVALRHDLAVAEQDEPGKKALHHLFFSQWPSHHVPPFVRIRHNEDASS
jgi:hypothetical protein